MRSSPRPTLLALALLVLALVPSLAPAGFIVSSETVTTTPGGTGYVQILLTNDSDTTETLSAFSVDLVLGGSGVRFTSVDDLTTPGYVFGGTGTGALTFDLFPNTGFIGSDVSLSPDGYVTLDAGATYGLARIAFEADGTAALGLRPISFVPGATTLFIDGGGNPYAESSISFRSGGVDVQSPVSAVPAPASAGMVLLGAACSLCVAWGKTRRRRAQSI
jgi:hypothetical protein